MESQFTKNLSQGTNLNGLNAEFALAFHLSLGNNHDAPEGKALIGNIVSHDKHPLLMDCAIICDKSYTEKANNRLGGVGDETSIISPEIYGKTNQEKFIPIIVERDEVGEAFIPAFRVLNF